MQAVAMVAIAETRAPQSRAAVATSASGNWGMEPHEARQREDGAHDGACPKGGSNRVPFGRVESQNRVWKIFSEDPEPRLGDGPQTQHPCLVEADTVTKTASGMLYFGFRYYHPQWGRFITRDPIEEAGGENLYRFVSNDPVNRWDLLGMYSILGLHFTDGGGIGGFVQDVGSYAGAAASGAAEGLYNATIGATVETYNEGSVHMEQGFQAIADGSYVEGALHVVAAVGKVGEMALDITPGGKVASEVVDKGTDLLGAAKSVQRSADNAVDASRTAARAAEPAADATKSVGRGKNNLKADSAAEGAHTTFKKNAEGKVTGHAEWKPNPQSPSGFDQVKRVDTQHANPHSHTNKATGENISTPHTHGKDIEGGVRPATSDELPSN